MTNVHAPAPTDVVWYHVDSVTHSPDGLYGLIVISITLSPLPI